MTRSPVTLRRIGDAAPARGFVLLDALVAIVIFSIGIVGMVALQGSAVQLTGAANYRLNAALLADQVIAQMWSSDLSALSTNYAGTSGKGGAQYLTWMSSIDCATTGHVSTCLPNVSTNPPSIVVTQEAVSDSGNTEYQVEITVSWEAPGDSNAHSYMTITDIGT
jgi:type IV pilus assembly protein PilV